MKQLIIGSNTVKYRKIRLYENFNFKDVLLTGKNDSLTREQAQISQVEVIFERVMTELVQKMREMNVSFLRFLTE